MYYYKYMMSFPYGIHVGDGRLSNSCKTIHSDTIFSAMCIEALNIGGESLIDKLVKYTKENAIMISDALPYIGYTSYIPKPIYHIESNEQNNDNKKAFKKLEYIATEDIDIYLNGELNPNYTISDIKLLGSSELIQKVNLSSSGDNELYSIGVYKYNDENGLYIIIGFENSDAELMIDEIMNSMQYSGLGGKRNSGYGRFSFVKEKFNIDELNVGSSELYMTLSTCMAKDSELREVLDGASYKLIRRSGFVQSETYSKKQVKKKDLFVFAPGSVFKKEFGGDVFDVSSGGKHPVYRYAKPFLIKIGGAK